MTMLGRGKRSADKADKADKARKAEEAARRAEELAEQARQAAEEARAALREVEEAEASQKATEGSGGGTEALRAAEDENSPADDVRDDDVRDDDASGDAEPVATEVAAKPAAAKSTSVEPADAEADADAAIDEEQAGDVETDAEAKTPAAGKSGRKAAVAKPAEAEPEGDAGIAAADDEAEDVDGVGEDDEDGEDEPVARRRVVVRAGLGVSGVVLLLLTVALGGALGWLWHKDRQLSGAEEARKQVAFAAAQAAQDLSSYDYRTVDSDLRRAAEHTTGKFRDDFVKESERVKSTARKEQTVTEGVALKTGIEQVSGNTAVALVFLNQETAKTSTVERLPHQYTLRLTMKKIDDRWLVEKLQLI
ncbi:Mce-associated membrane protein [Thermomonospora echinospora]|uniref:Mce-associated membrane protein n=1 Tax=Thermomonospora echinospora TaxID=1992 RepID=A0A1H5Z8S4_9ACTN|nr:hypothetical protein [Thermomonospora echinospora]SEG32135.1 Mce-associated membrane protein [Thermomonospora echinospora]